MAVRKSSGGAAVAPRAKAKSAAAPRTAPAVPAPATAASSRASACECTSSKAITQEMIAKRAYQIWQSGKGGTDWQNWVQAERELRAGK